MGSEGKEKFGGGWKGLLYDMFIAVKRGDPEKYKEKKKLQQFLRKNWNTFKANEKFLEENSEMIDVIREATERGTILPEDIAIFNELVERDPRFLKELDLNRNEVRIAIPLSKIIDDKKYPDAVKADSDLLEDTLREMHFKNRKIDPDDLEDLEVEDEPDKGGEREIVFTTDMRTGLDTMKKLGLSTKDFMRKL